MENCMIEEPTPAWQEPEPDLETLYYEDLDAHLVTSVSIPFPWGYLQQSADEYEVEVLIDELDLDQPMEVPDAA